jgi:hypothetical protein
MYKFLSNMDWATFRTIFLNREDISYFGNALAYCNAVAAPRVFFIK